MTAIDQYLDSHAARFEEELCEFLRIPSVSADPSRRDDVHRTAEWLAGQFRRMRFTVKVIPTDNFPLVYAESPAVPGAPTALMYGHYDVQPPDPLERWLTPPFEPSRRDGSLYARGANDDKGQLLTHLKSAEAWMAVEGRLPVNLKFIIEGEEEVGSDGLKRYFAEHADSLACDCIVLGDGVQFAPGVPAITYGLRGLAYYELHVTGPNRDLHSGSFGGAVTNPANILAQMLAGLIDHEGRVTIPGFYDDVVPLSNREREAMAALPFDEKEYFEQIGVVLAAGEAGYTTVERRCARPTYDISGLWSGYQGEGAKTVLPASAGANFSFRLVPNQDPAKIAVSLKRRLRELCPPGVRFELIELFASPGVLVPLDSPYLEAAAQAIEYAFGAGPCSSARGPRFP